MNRNKRFMAGAAALVVAAVGFAGLQGLANAGTNLVTLPGSFFLGNTAGATVATTNNTFTDTITLTNSPSSPNAGDLVFVTLSGVNGPSTGPADVNANGQIVRAKISLTGAQTATVVLASHNNSTTGAATTASCTYPAVFQPRNSAGQSWATYGQFTASGNGSATLALNQLMFDDQGDGFEPGTTANICPGTANNADYYISAVTQTAGSGLAGLARTAPVNSSIVQNTFTITGPNASQSANATFQSVTGYVRPGAGAPPTSTPVVVPLTGTVWTANLANTDFTVEYCNSAGNTCDATAITTTLATDGTGNLTGDVGAPGGLTTGVRAIKITENGSLKTSLTPIVVLGTATITLSPNSGGPGTVISITGSNFNPSKAFTVYGYKFGFPPPATTDATVAGTASATGTVTASFTVQDVLTTGIAVYQGIPGAPNASNPSATSAFTLNQDRCIADSSNVNSGSCNTKQNVNVSVLEGQLNQRAYTNATPTSGSTNSAAVSPVAGTSNVNSNATTINLGTVTTPLAPTAITGRLNDIVVSDNRGGTFGWSLTATMPNFTSTTGGVIANSRATVNPSCVAATSLTALDYTTGVAIVGFDSTKNAPGESAGASNDLSTTRNLCTKSTATNTDTGSSGGVYNVGGTIVLTVPAFQKAGVYVTTMTITLS